MEQNNIIIYNSDNGKIRIDVFVENETIWLNLNQLSELFSRDKSVISRHIKNIYLEEELEKNSTVAFFATVQKEGNRNITRETEFYSLDMIISIGYRVNSKVGIAFRRWATDVLKSYMIKGFSMDDERLKNNNNPLYFEELLARIREIRSSEKVFWRKILDIYATSIDYDAKAEETVTFFKTVQNKIHYATHGNTAAELIYTRVDSEKENLGLTNYKGNYPTRDEATIAKNYLSIEEMEILNRMIEAYLNIAELNALGRNVMKMKDWIVELDDFLKLTKKGILKHKGIISHEKALEKANKEYDKYQNKLLSNVEKDYLEVINNKLEEYQGNK
jgi:Virulence protein